MHGITVLRLHPRRFEDGRFTRGMSCDEDGVFLAGQTTLVARAFDAKGKLVYRARHLSEINFALTAGYGERVDFSGRIGMLHQIARHMTEGDWTAARIATLHLRLPEIADEAALARLAKAEVLLKAELIPSVRRAVSRPESGPTTASAQGKIKGADQSNEATGQCSCRPAGKHWRASRKRDVSNEPRIPRGEPGGGQWTSDGTASGGAGPRPTRDPSIIPAQAIEPPMPWVPFFRPMSPLEIPRSPIEPAVPRPQFPAPPAEVPRPPT